MLRSGFTGHTTRCASTQTSSPLRWRIHRSSPTTQLTRTTSPISARSGLIQIRRTPSGSPSGALSKPVFASYSSDLAFLNLAVAQKRSSAKTQVGGILLHGVLADHPKILSATENGGVTRMERRKASDFPQELLNLF